MNDLVPVYFAGTQGHVFICLHGAGHSALSFAALAKHLKSESIVAAFDFRGHGGNLSENETDLSETTLIQDTVEIIKFVSAIYPNNSIILVGHSMGGSIATKAAAHINKEHQNDSISK